MVQTQKDYLVENGRVLLDDLIKSEIREQSRMIAEDAEAAAFIPVCARYPYEVWVAPLRPVAWLSDLTNSEIKSLSRVLKTVLLKFDHLWNRPFPYLLALYQAPTDGAEHPEFHMHFEFYPPYRSRDRLKYLAGTELAAGMFVNDALPEEKAAELRNVKLGDEFR
jgi:UDPglucose--hexose-1-phosphate uridylyltransferase